MTFHRMSILTVTWRRSKWPDSTQRLGWYRAVIPSYIAHSYPECSIRAWIYERHFRVAVIVLWAVASAAAAENVEGTGSLGRLLVVVRKRATRAPWMSPLCVVIVKAVDRCRPTSRNLEQQHWEIHSSFLSFYYLPLLLCGILCGVVFLCA